MGSSTSAGVGAALSERLSQRLTETARASSPKTSERELKRFVANDASPQTEGVEIFSSLDSGPYESMTPQQALPQLAWCLQRHALIVWIVLPAWAIIQSFMPRWHPTRMSGYSNSAVLVLGAVEMHHFFTELQAWNLAKCMLLTPERTVMRQLGVMRKRSRLVPLGFLEVIDLYTDLVFPFLAVTCEPGITHQWIHYWHDFPGLGDSLARLVCLLEFWRVAGFFAFAMLFQGLFHLWRLTGKQPDRSSDALLSQQSQGIMRVDATDFYLMADFANMAMMPSVAMLCEEMASQRRFFFDPRDAGKKSLEELGASALRHESACAYQQEKYEHDERAYFTFVLLTKVVLGNVVQLYLQGTFFSLSFESTGIEAKAKVLLSMAFSLLVALVRCKSTASHLGCLGYVIMLFVVLFSIWISLRMYHTYHCQSHLWNLTTGCVAEKARRYPLPVSE